MGPNLLESLRKTKLWAFILIILLIIVIAPLILGQIYFSISNQVRINNAKSDFNKLNITRKNSGLPTYPFDKNTVSTLNIFKFISNLIDPVSISSSLSSDGSPSITTIKHRNSEKIISGGTLIYEKSKTLPNGEVMNGTIKGVSGGTILYSGSILNAPSIGINGVLNTSSTSTGSVINSYSPSIGSVTT
jgi:hypothetical protein